jgi:hypothetical protein
MKGMFKRAMSKKQDQEEKPAATPAAAGNVASSQPAAAIPGTSSTTTTVGQQGSNTQLPATQPTAVDHTKPLTTPAISSATPATIATATNTTAAAATIPTQAVESSPIGPANPTGSAAPPSEADRPAPALTAAVQVPPVATSSPKVSGRSDICETGKNEADRGEATEDTPEVVGKGSVQATEAPAESEAKSDTSAPLSLPSATPQVPVKDSESVGKEAVAAKPEKAPEPGAPTSVAPQAAPGMSATSGPLEDFPTSDKSP